MNFSILKKIIHLNKKNSFSLLSPRLETFTTAFTVPSHAFRSKLIKERERKVLESRRKGKKKSRKEKGRIEMGVGMMEKNKREKKKKEKNVWMKERKNNIKNKK